METLTKGIPSGSVLGTFIFNIFMYDDFYFIQKYDFTNYADDPKKSFTRKEDLPDYIYR